MTERKAAIVALTFVMLAPRGAFAQIASKVEAGSIMTQQDGEVPTSVFSVAPGIRVDLPYLALAAHGSAWLTGQQWQIADGTISGNLISPVYKHFRAEVIGNASRVLRPITRERPGRCAGAFAHAFLAERWHLVRRWRGASLAYCRGLRR
jgi:hypothetical protein